MDFRCLKISDLTINGKEVSEEGIFVNQKIFMPDLKIGRNEVSLNFVNLYKKEGCGLHSFTDSEDGE